jgi:hypothetical protein
MGLYDVLVAGCETGPFVGVVAGAFRTITATLRALWTWRFTRRRCLGCALTTSWFLAMSW